MTIDQIRSFISIDVEDQRILSEIEGVQSSLLNLGGDLKAVERENIHLTLKFLGDIDTAKLEKVKSVLSRLKFSPFGMEIRGVGAFPSLGRMNVIWVSVGEGWNQVELIYDQTERLLSELGFRRENRAFSPHITIARVRSGRRKDEMARFLQEFSDRSLGTFTADRVRLKKSVLSRSGPRYSTLFEAVAQ